MYEAALLALETAIRFESDGRDYYLDAAERARNPLAAKIFLALAEDEKDHVRRVREIYEELKGKAGWPSPETMVARQSGVLDIFARERRLAGAEDADSRAALAKAAENEKKGIAFYRDRFAQASCDGEREFFRRLVAEEEHHLRAVEEMLAALS